MNSLSLAAAAMGLPPERFLMIPESEQTLTDLRILAGLTQVKLAERSGISRKVLGGLESGRGRLTIDRAAALADALKVSEQTIHDAHNRSARP